MVSIISGKPRYAHACGHKQLVMFRSWQPSEHGWLYAAFVEWKDTTGMDGNKSECFGCFLKRHGDEQLRWNE